MNLPSQIKSSVGLWLIYVTKTHMTRRMIFSHAIEIRMHVTKVVSLVCFDGSSDLQIV